MTTTLQQWVQNQITKIESDERYHCKAALVQVNAPLALHQVDLKSRMQVLKKAQAVHAEDAAHIRNALQPIKTLLDNLNRFPTHRFPAQRTSEVDDAEAAVKLILDRLGAWP